MLNILKNQKGMNIVGQGGKIMLFMLPSLIAAISIHMYLPKLASLPLKIGGIKLLGYVTLIPGLILWGGAVIQLMTGFHKGKLITGGAYSIVRNPIYSSAAFFILPAVSLITMTWVYFVPAAFLYTGVLILIGKEEEKLIEAFGKEYRDYSARVSRMTPMKKPGKSKKMQENEENYR